MWIGVVVQIGGRILDGIWHSSHDEFEGASQQLEAHWLLWLGIAITLAAAAVALIRLTASQRDAGYAVILAGGTLYVPVAIWHFVEHANHNDPELAHYLLAVGQVVIIAGAIAAAILTRRRDVLTAS
ncbi:MAG: hypothetical protein ACRDLO_07600 [Solirubrobacterales bacterium]